jgi:hypothetical protein
MVKLLITATHGFDNCSHADMPFFVAKGAKESGIFSAPRHRWRRARGTIPSVGA